MAVITISRLYGSGGDQIASRACEKLGYRLFDKRLVAKVAWEVGLTETEIVDFSEDRHEMRSFLDRLLGRHGASFTHSRVWKEDSAGVRSLDVVNLDEAQCVGLVRVSVRAAYNQGDFVIVGRGGQAILRDDPGVLHVRIEAPLESRIRRIRTQEGTDYETAKEVAIKRERATLDYLKRFHGVDWADAALYHLVINAGRLDIEAAANVIAGAASHLPAPVPAQ